MIIGLVIEIACKMEPSRENSCKNQTITAWRRQFVCEVISMFLLQQKINNYRIASYKV